MGGARLYAKKTIQKILYREKYDTDDLISLLERQGLKRGSVVCLHSAFSLFFNYDGSAQELINAIIKTIGKEGTLMMPAFPKYELANKVGYIFDKENDQTGAGYLAEVFRNTPGVKRSINVRHSVCAIGKYADYLCRDHHRSHDCWDYNSPWYRLCELKGLVFTLGLPRSYMGTIIHCTESILQDSSSYWKQFFNTKYVYRYYDDKHIVNEYEEYNSNIHKVVNNYRVFRRLPKKAVQVDKLSNLEIKCLQSDLCLSSFLDMAKKGITIFSYPKFYSEQ